MLKVWGNWLDKLGVSRPQSTIDSASVRQTADKPAVLPAAIHTILAQLSRASVQIFSHVLCQNTGLSPLSTSPTMTATTVILNIKILEGVYK